MDEDELLAEAFNAGFEDDNTEGAGDKLPPKVEEQEAAQDADTVAQEPTEYQKLEQLFNDRLEQKSREIEARVEERYQKVTGKLGEFNKKLLDSQATGKSLSITKDDLKYVTENFGEEFAEGLAQDLAGLKGGSGGDDSIKEYVAAIEEKHNDHVISMKHKGWKSEVSSTEFTEYFNGLSPDAQRDSDNPIEIIELLDGYKELKALSNDETFKSWQQSVGVAIPNDLVVDAFKGWLEIGAIDGFHEWANSLTDPSTRQRIGRDTDKNFMASAKQAFIDYKGLNSSNKPATETKKPVNKRLEAAILPTTSSDYSGKGNSLEDAFLSGFDD
jgi:hypothetical protein